MTDKPDALLPCPFCGGEAEFQTDKGPTGELYGWVGCNQCDAMSPHCDIRSMQPEELHPIDAWNTRHPPAPQDGTGWLIEHEDEPKWLTLKPGEAAYEVCWTKESNDALRFARRVDADDYASTFLDEGPIRITEHRWG